MIKAKCMAENSSALCSSRLNSVSLIFLSLGECCAASLIELCFYVLLCHNYYQKKVFSYIHLFVATRRKQIITMPQIVLCIFGVTCSPCRSGSHVQHLPASSHSVSSTLFLLQPSSSPCVSLNAPLFTISSQTKCAS